MSERSERASARRSSALALSGAPSTPRVPSAFDHAPKDKRLWDKMVDAATVRTASELRCLSVKDPWAKLIGTGRKPYELRKVICHWRGTLVICSSASASRTPDACAARERFAPWAPAPFGFALYVATLVDSFLADPDSEAHALGACCRPTKGEWVWHLTNVRALREPYPVSGMLGRFKVPDGLARHLRKERLI